MRHLRVAIVLIAAVLGAQAAAFEVEDRLRLDGATTRATVMVLSTTDVGTARPLLDAFLRARPDLSVDYTVASANEIHRAISDEGAAFDLVISSAMDLQMKLANDGLAAPHLRTAPLPDWAHWRDLVFGFALEPVVIVASETAFAGHPVPRTRRDLIAVLREEAGRFRGRIGTYDLAASGAGYLFATQDAGLGNAFWRLAEVIGRLDARLYCCSGGMIDDLTSGDLLLAYNVVGSYAYTEAARAPGLLVIEPEDFTLALVRTAVIPKTAPRPDLGAALLEFHLSAAGQAVLGDLPGVIPIERAGRGLPPSIRAIRLDPGLLVNLDRMRRASFLGDWAAAMTQP